MMRLSRIAACVLTLSFFSLAAGDPTASWLGSTVLPKRQEIRATDEKGVARIDPLPLDLTVHAERGDLVRVYSRSEGIIGWVPKADLVRGDEAEAYFDAQVAANPTAFAHRLRIEARALRRDPPRVDRLERDLADAEEVIRLAPKDWRSYHARARSREEKGDQSGAMADMNEAVRLAADSPWDVIEVLTRPTRPPEES